MKSEKDAYCEAFRMLDITVRNIGSIRLDCFSASHSTPDDFPEDTNVRIIPSNNTTVSEPPKWKNLFGSLMDEPMKILSAYSRVENWESQFSSDKRTMGWHMQQKREDRIRTAAMCKGTWHSLFNMAAGWDDLCFLTHGRYNI